MNPFLRLKPLTGLSFSDGSIINDDIRRSERGKMIRFASSFAIFVNSEEILFALP